MAITITNHNNEQLTNLLKNIVNSVVSNDEYLKAYKNELNGKVNEVDAKLKEISGITKTSQLTNDSNFVNTDSLQQILSDFYSGINEHIPTNISELHNDSGFITEHDIPNSNNNGGTSSGDSHIDIINQNDPDIDVWNILDESIGILYPLDVIHNIMTKNDISFDDAVGEMENLLMGMSDEEIFEGILNTCITPIEDWAYKIFNYYDKLDALELDELDLGGGK